LLMKWSGIWIYFEYKCLLLIFLQQSREYE